MVFRTKGTYDPTESDSRASDFTLAMYISDSDGDVSAFLHAFKRFIYLARVHLLIRLPTKMTDHSRKILLFESATLIEIKANLVKNSLWVHEINRY